MGAVKKVTYRVRPETAVLTRGFDPRLSVGAARPPVYRTSTFVFSSPEAAERAFAIALGKIRPTDDEDVDLIYARLSHPNAEILEDQLVPLERAAHAAAVFNSGMAAIATLLFATLARGSSLLHTQPLYGGTQHFVHQVLEPLGFQVEGVPAGDGAALAAAAERLPNLELILLETPANPTLRMSDIAHAVAVARRHPKRPRVAVDNTFLGPVFQHPLELGADLVVYSATKFLGGFSDVLAGVVMAGDARLVSELRGLRALFGNILQADESWILDSRLSTVGLRMNRQSKNAQKIAERLAADPRIERIHYPSLFTDPEQRRIRDAQCDFPGSLMAIEIRGGKAGAFEFLRRLKIARDAVSLGGVESLACHPASTTHSELSPAELAQAGITEGLVRLSIGTEHWRDLLADFEQALG
ncbi:MAG: PLP-dependent transferase [Deltaproteobacteria bacterium]|nr:PLP-dependent transferase [Deltaproteobacteria bacterium]